MSLHKKKNQLKTTFLFIIYYTVKIVLQKKKLFHFNILIQIIIKFERLQKSNLSTTSKKSRIMW
jgi:hypothetical protein